MLQLAPRHTVALAEIGHGGVNVGDPDPHVEGLPEQQCSRCVHVVIMAHGARPRRVRPTTVDTVSDRSGGSDRIDRRGLTLMVAVGALAAAAFAAAGAAYGTEQLLDEVFRGPAWLTVALPALGIVANSAIRYVGAHRSGPASIDAYIDSYHGRRIDDRQSIARASGGVASVGLGTGVDATGLAVLLGMWFTNLARRVLGRTSPDLLVLGAAAGFGAALDSPVAGGVLAVEIPFREGLSWRRLPIALVGSCAGYLARSAIDGFSVPWRTDVGVVGLRDVFIALGLAVLAGVASRCVALLSGRAEAGLGATYSRERYHLGAAAVLLVGVGLVARGAFDGVPLHLGPGTGALGWAATASAGGLLALLALRAITTGVSVLGRATGGLVIPLLVVGMISGRLLGQALDGNMVLLAAVGAAAVLGAGYRVPLAALVWLAEATHSIPAVALGTVVVLIAQRVGAGRSVSTAQRAEPVEPATRPDAA